MANEADNSGDFDAQAYRRALGGFGTGVALVAAHDAEGRAHGMIINSLTSVSLNPPIMLWCLANSSNAFPVFTNAAAFSLTRLISLSFNALIWFLMWMSASPRASLSLSFS